MMRLALLLLLSAPATAAPLADIVAGRTVATPGIAGLAAVVADRKGVVRAEALGDAVMGHRPLTVDTPVRVASISKAVVAIGVMRLVEQGRLDLDGDVSRWLGWQLRNPAFPDAKVTLRQLLSHTSGIDDAAGYRLPLGKSLQAEVPAHWAAAPPGTRFSYAIVEIGIFEPPARRLG